MNQLVKKGILLPEDPKSLEQLIAEKPKAALRKRELLSAYNHRYI